MTEKTQDIPGDDFAFLTMRAESAEMAAREERTCGMTVTHVCFVRESPGLSCAGRCLNAGATSATRVER